MITSKKTNILWLGMINIFFIIFCAICVIPVIAIISISLTNEMDIVKHGYNLIPPKLSFEAYKLILASPADILKSYGVSIFVSVFGTFSSLLITSMVAYPLSRKDFKHRNKISLYIFITMIFNGGMVPTFLVMTNVLNLYDSPLALIVPLLLSAYNIIILRTYFQSLPTSLIESAKIDGAREFRIFFGIILPLSKPALATIGMFTLLAYWNDFFSALLYLAPSSDFIPLQYMLYRIMANIQFLTSGIMKNANVSISLADIPNESARMAICMIAAGPMLFIFPFFQKYFVKGLTLGAVKG